MFQATTERSQAAEARTQGKRSFVRRVRMVTRRKYTSEEKGGVEGSVRAETLCVQAVRETPERGALHP